MGSLNTVNEVKICWMVYPTVYMLGIVEDSRCLPLKEN